MVRKSDRNKAGSSAGEKTPAKKATRSSRRRKKSTSESEPEPEPEIRPTVEEKEAESVLFEAQPAETAEQTARGRTRRSARNRNAPVAEPVELPSISEEAKKTEEPTWNDEAKSSTSKEEPAVPEGAKGGEPTTWKIQSSNGAGGEIQKLKICRQRLTDSAESSSSPAKDAASPRRKRRKHDSERAESAESHTDSESTTASAVANIPVSQEQDEGHVVVESEMTVDLAVEQAEIAEAIESIKDLAPAVVEEEVEQEVVMEERLDHEASETIVPEPEVEEKVEPMAVEEEEEVVEAKVVEKVVEEAKVEEKVLVEETKAEELPPVEAVKETPVATEGVEEGEIVPKRKKRDKSEEAASSNEGRKKSGKALKLSTEVAMEQIAKKLNERAALRTTTSKEADDKKEVVNAVEPPPSADTPVSGISEEGEISPQSTTPVPPKPTITVVKPSKQQEQTSKPCVLKRATESAPVLRRRRTSAKSKPKDEQIGISSTNLKLLVPEVEPVALDEVKEALLSTTVTTVDEQPAEELDEIQEEEETLADDEDKSSSVAATEGDDRETTGTTNADGDDDAGVRREEVTSPSINDKTSTMNVSAAKRQKRLSGSKEDDDDEDKPKRKLLKEVKDGNVTNAREVKKKTPIVITHEDSKENKPERKSDENHKMVRKITLVSDDGKALRRSLSPVGKKQTPTPVLFITNLVRPFTVPQLRELLARTGTIAPNGFYIDKIKSKCYVKYDDVEMAIETRHALHGVRWPVNNPKTLRVEFSSDEAMGVVQKAAEDELNSSTTVMVKYETIGDRDALNSGWLSEKAALKPARRVTTAVREWDVGKSASGEVQLPVTPTAATPNEGRKSKAIDDDWSVKDRIKDRGSKVDIDGRRRASSPDMNEPARKTKKRDTEAPAKLLDDLFKKTSASPCIYWLPLTDEQIAVKEELRRQQFAEHERRLAELRKDVSSSRRDRDRSRDRDRERDRDKDRDRDRRKK